MFPSGVFSSRDLAEDWIRRYSLTGTLTQYPIDAGMYDHAIAHGAFSSKKPEHATSEFIGSGCFVARTLQSVTEERARCARLDLKNVLTPGARCARLDKLKHVLLGNP
jgi:hypothetical protein